MNPCSLQNNVICKMIHLKILYMYEQNLALNNHQGLICY